MALREVLQLGDPRLRRRSVPVPDPAAPEVRALARDLEDTLDHWRATTSYGRAIGAPQLGELLRLVLVKIDEPIVMVNPTIVDRSEEDMVVWDACLSFLSFFFQVRRSVWVTVRWTDPSGRMHQELFEGDRSELIQHELDHLDGILAVDRMTDVRTMCTREEFERRFRDESPYALTAAGA